MLEEVLDVAVVQQEEMEVEQIVERERSAAG
jgi:hypothetical protein